MKLETGFTFTGTDVDWFVLFFTTLIAFVSSSGMSDREENETALRSISDSPSPCFAHSAFASRFFSCKATGVVDPCGGKTLVLQSGHANPDGTVFAG